MSQDKKKVTASAIIGWLLIAAAIAATAVIAITRDGSSVPAGFVTAEDGQFALDGEPYYYASTNNYELMYQTGPTVTNFFSAAKAEGYDVIRAWAFLDIGTPEGDLGVEINNKGTYFHYWDVEADAPAFNDGENGLERLDWVIYQAKEHDIKMMLPLVNNWTAFGGIDQYVRWADGEYHDDFFTDEQIKQWYKNWVEHLLERENIYTGVKYKDEPAIMMWELGNELRCSESGPYPSSPDCGSDIFVEWADEMSAFVKSIDPHHLVGFGGEGFLCTEPGGPSTLYNCEESGDPVAILALENIDVHGIHVYPNHWTPTPTPEGWEAWAAEWIETHGQIAADANVPYYIGEYGWIDKGHRLPVFDNWLNTFYEAGGDGSHFWIMQPASSIGQPPDGVGFTERCPSATCTLVGNYARHYGEGVDWNEFGPVADNDVATTYAGTPVSFSVVDNDVAFGDKTLDLATLDLDPESPGIQREFAVDRGVFTVDDSGVVTFVPTEGVEAGAGRGSYTIADSDGMVTEVAKFSATILREATDSDSESEGDA